MVECKNTINTLNSNFQFYGNLIYRGRIGTWSDGSQIPDKAGLYKIDTISDDFWSEINKSTLNNVGDYTLLLFYPNGLDGVMNYASGFLVSPRWQYGFCYVQCWGSVYSIIGVQCTNIESSGVN